jgi:peptidoglycan/LPS O-acetylase OafA/YrhL
MRLTPLPDKRVPSLDGLRACSVMFVVFDHLCISGSLPFHQSWIDFGNLGVRIFFVISGFIITTLLLEEKNRTGTISLKAFYARRFFRIVPIWACYVTVILVGLVALRRLPSLHDMLGVLTYNVDYLAPAEIDFTHLWSLSVEEKFYLIWPVTLVLAGQRAAAFGAVAVGLASPLLRFRGALTGASYEDLLWPFHNTADALAIGCLLAIGRGALENNKRWQAFFASPWKAGLIPLVIIALAASHKLGPVFWLAGVTALNLAIAAGIYAAIKQPESAVGRLLNGNPLRIIGVWSYGIYLWQQPLTFHRKTGLLSVFPVNVIVLLLVSALGYYLIEKRTQEYGRRLARRWSRPKLESFLPV